MKRTYYVVLWCFLLIFFVSGCIPRTKIPVDRLEYAGNGERGNCGLIVFLRGRGGSHADFEEAGFVEAVWKRRLPYDMVAPDLHFGYYADRSVVTRLKEDIIEPAKARGCKQVWLVGVSMGGFGAIFYLREHAEDVTGIVLIAPYLGENEVVDEIVQAGGLPKWDKQMEDQNDYTRELWIWLKQYYLNQKNLPPMYMGYGRDDSFVDLQKLLSDYLPKEQVTTIEGSHRIPTFQELFDIHLEEVPFDDLKCG